MLTLVRRAGRRLLLNELLSEAANATSAALFAFILLLIRAPFDRLAAAERRIAEPAAKLGEPPKIPNNARLPALTDQQANRRNKPRGGGPRQSSPGRVRPAHLRGGSDAICRSNPFTRLP